MKRTTNNYVVERLKCPIRIVLSWNFNLSVISWVKLYETKIEKKNSEQNRKKQNLIAVSHELIHAFERMNGILIDISYLELIQLLLWIARNNNENIFDIVFNRNAKSLFVSIAW